MDAARKKAIFRAKLNAQKKEKRINSPLVRYNEFDQPVCRVCDVVLKSDSQWDAHQASRKHHEAIKSIKASAVKRIKAPGRPCYYFHPNMNHLSQRARAEQEAT
ncbi:hypothetical protein AB3S75_000956 [Citrus x aurantiifolia]